VRVCTLRLELLLITMLAKLAREVCGIVCNNTKLLVIE